MHDAIVTGDGEHMHAGRTARSRHHGGVESFGRKARSVGARYDERAVVAHTRNFWELMWYTHESNIYVAETGRYGKSLFAKRLFRKGEIVFVAFGPLIRKPTRFTIPIDHDLKIDPTVPAGNPCQYICHSCEPNLGINDRTLFVAMRDILRGEEVVVDYAMLGYEYGAELSDGERVCRCGRPNCRGVLGSYRDLPEDLKTRYKGYISDYLLEPRYNDVGIQDRISR